jgi:predicted nuclease of predicted toxin-antitoxin system
VRILADENFPGAAVAALRARGHDIAWVFEDARGADDVSVVERAAREARLIVTFDKDFGELAFRQGIGNASGIVLFRIPSSSGRAVAEIAVSALEGRDDWAGHFAVVESDRVRLTRLPDGE